MKIGKNDIIAGMPAIEMRKLLISLGEGASKEWFKRKKPHSKH
jgi:hypothetical protein